MKAIVTHLIKLGVVIGTAWLLLLITLTSLTAQVTPALPNGVAAGDTTQTSTLLWTRGTTIGNVLFQYSTDPAFGTNVLTKTTLMTDPLQPVKVEITGLSPATTYFYRVTDAADVLGIGQFRTAVTVGTYAGLRFGVSGDWGGHLAPYPAIGNTAERDLDFFVELGDTTYADVSSPALPLSSATTLQEFRLKHNEGYATHLGLNTWADLRASTSILATIDDHEIRDNFAGGADPASDPRFGNTASFINETQLYRNGLQAFQEYNPLRDEAYGSTGDPRTTNKRKLYRFNTYGSDAAVFILDTRSFRDEPFPQPTTLGEVLIFLTESLTDTSRTFLGAQQLADLKADLQQAQADGITWKFIMLSVPIQNLGPIAAPDRFEGYAAERSDLLRFINQHHIENVVFVAADLHGTLVNNLTYQEVPLGPQIPTNAFEVIVGPVAIDPPFGPAVVDLAEGLGLITPAERADYDSRSREGKDAFIEAMINDLITLFPLNYDPIGLAGSSIQATLLQGGYVAVHTYDWTEFEINQRTQVLTVTTYGIDFYTEAELLANPLDIITRTPTIVSQFVVTPSQVLIPLDTVVITGSTIGITSTSYTFTATVSPINSTTPITYVWQASDQATITQTNNLSDTISFSWSVTGVKTITVTAQNDVSLVKDLHPITIMVGTAERSRLYLPLILKQ